MILSGIGIFESLQANSKCNDQRLTSTLYEFGQGVFKSKTQYDIIFATAQIQRNSRGLEAGCQVVGMMKRIMVMLS